MEENKSRKLKYLKRMNGERASHWLMKKVKVPL